MPEELHAKLTVALAGEIETYNEVLSNFSALNSNVESLTNERDTAVKNAEIAQEQVKNLTLQLGNVISRIPITSTDNAPQNLKQRLNNIDFYKK
jgi:outer membrane murein-binding lipoprotein Lpp